MLTPRELSVLCEAMEEREQRRLVLWAPAIARAVAAVQSDENIQDFRRWLNTLQHACSESTGERWSRIKKHLT